MTPEQQRLIDQIILHEGKRSKPYKDTVGKLTIGVGRNLDDVGLFDDEIELLLINDLKRFERSLDKSLPWWRDLDEVRQRVILDMCFNMGLNGLLGFKNTLAKIKAHDWAGARRGMLQSKWAKQVGARAIRLADMMLTGKDYR